MIEAIFLAMVVYFIVVCIYAVVEEPKGKDSTYHSD